MDKKQLNEIVESIVADVAKKSGLSEAEARVFVGVALRTNRQAFIDAVVIPVLQVHGSQLAS